MRFPRQSTYRPAQGLLFELNSMEVISGDTKQKRVAIVKLAANQNVSQHDSSPEVQTLPFTAQGNMFC